MPTFGTSTAGLCRKVEAQLSMTSCLCTGAEPVFLLKCAHKQQTAASPNASLSRPGVKTLAEVLPGEEVLQRPGLVLLLADDAVSLLLLHLPNARREGVDVVEHGLHGDGDFVRLLTRGGKKTSF